MAATSEQKTAIPGGDALFNGMQGRLKALYISTASREGAWLAEAFAADSAAEILLEEVTGQAAGVERLREEVFDAILVSHEPGELEALDLIEGYRTGGAEEPIIVLGTPAEAEMAVLCYEAGADGYVCVDSCTTRHLIWVVALAVQKRQLIQENRRHRQSEQSRLQREQDEARRLLEEQCAAVGDFRAAPSCGGDERDRKRCAPAFRIARPLPRAIAHLCHHGFRQSGRRTAAVGATPGSGGNLRANRRPSCTLRWWRK